eukprot:CAMPEP_0197417370 /NCGR_PEP_ID=MMETSP1170-20131217/3430_1 /TAXON_ID=54406 /ORGANISM="Sarcinochrysis sp, Strain CCMP770" /LENGTH=54 /DNA_ID=CAMNT_0042944331 /DNA_START=119 /DNA_END=280 /DNA_ORIENTATION=+
MHDDQAIDWLIENKSPLLDSETIKSNASSPCQEEFSQFYDEDEAGGSWTKKRSD